MISRRQNGFAIGELVIALVVLGLLAALILNSLQIEQAKMRDAARRNDIDNIAAGLEACYGDKCHSTYPSLLQLTDTFANGFVYTNLAGLRSDSLYDSSAGIIQSNATSAATQYQYVSTPPNCTGTVGSAPCTGYTLRAYQETNPEYSYAKESLHK